MLSLLRCTLNHLRRRGSRNLTFLAVVTILITSPSLSASNQDLENIHEISSHPAVPLEILSLIPTAPSSLSSLPEDLDGGSSKIVSRNQQIPIQDTQTSPLQQRFLGISNFIISACNNVRNPRQFFSSQGSISRQEHDRTSTQTLNHPNRAFHLQSRDMPMERELGHLTKRQQASSDTPTQYFPQPFDTSLGTEFESDTCQPFMSKFLNHPGFQDCHPFSLLLITSDAFFRSYSALSQNASPRASSTLSVKQVLDASCRVDADKCAALLDQLAVSIKSPTIGCAKDLEKQNSLPLQALEGLRNYQLMRNVACLTTSDVPTLGEVPRVQNRTNTTQSHTSIVDSNNSTANSTQAAVRYCFEKAVSSTKPDDLYYYYLPLGTSLPSGTQSSCDHCTRSIMKLYSIDASNITLPLHNTYPSARTMTNSECGPGFAPHPVNVANRLASEAPRRFIKPSIFPLELTILMYLLSHLSIFGI